MKKIITSMAAVAALTSGAYAAAATLTVDDFAVKTTTVNPKTYNTEFLATTKHDLNNTTATGQTGLSRTNSGIIYTPGDGLGNSHTVEFTLTGGATFSNAADWRLTSDDGSNQVVIATFLDHSDDNTTIRFSVTTAVDGGAPVYLTTGAATSGVVTNFQDFEIRLPKGATQDIGLNVVAKIGDTKATNNSVDTTFLGAKASKLSVALNTTNCAKREIDDQDLTKFKTVAPSTTTDTCDYAVTPDIADIDFDYTDAQNEIKVVIGGNIPTALTGIASTLTGAALTKQSDGSYAYTNAAALLTANNPAATASSIDDTLTFTVDGSTEIKDVDFTMTATVLKAGDAYGQGDTAASAETEINKVIYDGDFTKWYLNIYRAEVMNIRYNAETNKKATLTVFNTSDAAASASITMTSPTGVVTTIDDIVEVPANGAAYITTAMMTGLVNGSKVVVTLPVIAQYGDLVASEVKGDQGSVALRVVDNNGDNNGN